MLNRGVATPECHLFFLNYYHRNRSAKNSAKPDFFNGLLGWSSDQSRLNRRHLEESFSDFKPWLGGKEVVTVDDEGIAYFDAFYQRFWVDTKKDYWLIKSECVDTRGGVKTVRGTFTMDLEKVEGKWMPTKVKQVSKHAHGDAIISLNFDWKSVEKTVKSEYFTMDFMLDRNEELQKVLDEKRAKFLEKNK